MPCGPALIVPGRDHLGRGLVAGQRSRLVAFGQPQVALDYLRQRQGNLACGRLEQGEILSRLGPPDSYGKMLRPGNGRIGEKRLMRLVGLIKFPGGFKGGKFVSLGGIEDFLNPDARWLIVRRQNGRLR